MATIKDASRGREGAVVMAISFPPDVVEKAEAFLRAGGSIEEAIKRFLFTDLSQ